MSFNHQWLGLPGSDVLKGSVRQRAWLTGGNHSQREPVGDDLLGDQHLRWNLRSCCLLLAAFTIVGSRWADLAFCDRWRCGPGARRGESGMADAPHPGGLLDTRNAGALGNSSRTGGAGHH